MEPTSPAAPTEPAGTVSTGTVSTSTAPDPAQPAPVTVPAPAAGPPATPGVNTAVSSGNGPGSVEDRFYARAFALAAVALLGWVLYQIIAPFLGPLMWALFIAFLLYPMHVWLTQRLKGRENMSAILLTVGAFVMLVGPLAGMSAAFVAQASDLVEWVQATLNKRTTQQDLTLVDLPLIGPLLRWITGTFGLRTGQIQTWIAQGAQNLPQVLAGLGGSIFLGAVNTVLAFVMMLFMLFFCVRDGAQWVALLRDLIPLNVDRRQKLMDHAAAVTRAVVFGTGITALVQGAVVGVAFLITGLSSPVVFGVFAALLALLPIGGTALVWIPATLVLIGNDRWGMAIIMIVFGVLSSSLDNVLRPLLISGRAEIGTLTVFLGVLGGAAAFGPIGLFLGPVVIALIIALVQFAQEQRKTTA